MELDIKEELLECIEIEMEKTIHKQIVDYVKIPFQCGRCHVYGHILENCVQKEGNSKVWKKKVIQKKNKTNFQQWS